MIQLYHSNHGIGDNDRPFQAQHHTVNNKNNASREIDKTHFSYLLGKKRNDQKSHSHISDNFRIIHLIRLILFGITNIF